MNRSRSYLGAAAAGALLLAQGFLPVASTAQEPGEKERLDVGRARSIAARWRGNFVPVDIWLKKSEGDAPNQHALEHSEERPAEIAAFAVDPKTLWLPDLDIEPRFIDRITAGPDAAPARLQGYFLNAPGVVVTVEAPVAGVETVKFLPADKVPPVDRLFAVASSLEDGAWTTAVGPAAGGFRFRENSVWATTGAARLITDGEGNPAGYSFAGKLPVENAPGLWRGVDIAAEPVLTTSVLDRLEEMYGRQTADLAPAVKVFLRREEEPDEEMSFHRVTFAQQAAGLDLDRNDLLAGGLAIGPRKVLVHLPLDRQTAMRIERVVVIAGGEERPARFLGAFKDFGAFLAEVEDKDLPAHLDLTAGGAYSNLQPVIRVAADYSSGKRRDYVDFSRVVGFVRAYRNVLEPTLAQFPRRGTLLYSAADQALLGAVLEVRREGIEDESMSRFYYRMRYTRGSSSMADLRVLTSAELAALIGSAPGSFDPRLRPCPLEREKDMVWFGVEYQPLNLELARTHAVEIPTRGGQIGLLAQRVYPGSPAEKGGIRAGDILLSIRKLGRPEPVDLEGGDEENDIQSRFSFGELPDEIAGMAMMGILPWRSQRNLLNMKLTEMGAGAEVELIYLRGGERKTIALQLAIGPPDFENAPKEKIEPIGLTVKDLTFEVRTHYQLRPDAPGVVVAKVESGSSAAVAQILPYEIITSVNGEPVKSAGEFRGLVEKVLEGPARDLELRVERLGKSRIVKIRA